MGVREEDWKMKMQGQEGKGKDEGQDRTRGEEKDVDGREGSYAVVTWQYYSSLSPIGGAAVSRLVGWSVGFVLIVSPRSISSSVVRQSAAPAAVQYGWMEEGCCCSTQRDIIYMRREGRTWLTGNRDDRVWKAVLDILFTALFARYLITAPENQTKLSWSDFHHQLNWSSSIKLMQNGIVKCPRVTMVWLFQKPFENQKKMI